MSKYRAQTIKAVEKFKKAANKEIERLNALDKKSKGLHDHSDKSRVILEYFDRLAQKRQQLSDDLKWSTRILEDLHAELKKKNEVPKDVPENTKPTAKKTKAKAPTSKPAKKS